MILLDGKKTAEKIKNNMRNLITALQKNNVQPRLCVICAGNNDAVNSYMANKRKMCEEFGISFTCLAFPEDVSETELLEAIDRCNEDDNIHGILVEMPLPLHINKRHVLNEILPDKDVDGVTAINAGKMVLDEMQGFTPCTALSIIKILEDYNIEMTGKQCVVIGRSETVGMPTSILMLKQNATVTICHSYTQNLKEITKQADILIVATGKPKFIDSSYIKPGAVVVDAGIHQDENNKLCGDVNFDDVKDIVSAITPVPGGVGPVTTVMLLMNCIRGVLYGK